MKPLRTWLFAPGMDERKMTRALASAADAVILDLEDAVAISQKPKAREMVRSVLAEVAPERRVFVRVNDVSTGLLAEDLGSVCTGGLGGIVLPKGESAEMVRTTSALIDAFEARAGLPEGQIRMTSIIETARGVMRIGEIAGAGGRLETLMFGAGDFTSDIGIPTANVGPHLTHAKIQTVLACRSAGLQPPVDTVFFDVADEAGFAADCREGRALGFQGKAVIHPAQIETGNTVFAPSAEEIAAAQRVFDAYREAERQGVGAISVDGKLVDYAMLKNAEKVLATARALDLA